MMHDAKLLLNIQHYILIGSFHAWYVTIDDHLLALHTRVSPTRAIGVDLFKDYIWVYSVSWPNSAQCKIVWELCQTPEPGVYLAVMRY